VPLHALQRALTAHGAFYPPVPTYDGAVAGGVIATNAASAVTFKYGSTREWVRAITVVLADGSVLALERGQTTAHSDGYFELVRGDHTTRIPVPGYRMPDVSKRSAGYFSSPEMDLLDLFIGSEGTLGIVTEASFIVMPRRPNLSLVFWHPTSDKRLTTWRTGNPRGIDVAGVEHLDRRSLEILHEDGTDRTHEVPLPADTAMALLAHIELSDDAVPSSEDAYGQIASALRAGAPDTPLVQLCRLIAQAGLLDRTEIALPGNRRRQAQLLAIREAVPEAVNRRIGAAQQTSPTIQKTAADMIVQFEQFEESLQRFRDAFEQRRLDYAI
jgi:D-lactate dehydrogenase (cytochrome)